MLSRKILLAGIVVLAGILFLLSIVLVLGKKNTVSCTDSTVRHLTKQLIAQYKILPLGCAAGTNNIFLLKYDYLISSYDSCKKTGKATLVDNCSQLISLYDRLKSHFYDQCDENIQLRSIFEDKKENQSQIKWHHAFKSANGYSDLEISQKRAAIENVMIPDSFETHQRRLQKAGFEHSYQWFQAFNFASFVAIKN